MRAISPAELLDVWETGLARSPVERALRLLAVACTDATPEQLAKLSIGRRDGRLLELRVKLFGPTLVSLATCPTCGEKSELQFSAADITPGPSPAPDDVLTEVAADHEVRFRLPNSLDLLQLVADEDPALKRRRLLGQCLQAARRGGQEIPVEQLPPEVMKRVVERMALADPQADVQLALTCTHCAHQWQAPFDIVTFMWTEIHTWAVRLLQEVHALASAYGWSEADILALSPWRRRTYLELGAT